MLRYHIAQYMAMLSTKLARIRQNPPLCLQITPRETQGFDKAGDFFSYFYSILTRHHLEAFSCQSMPAVLIHSGTSKCTILEDIPCRQVELRCYVLICCNRVYEISFSQKHLNPAFFQCFSAGSLSPSGCNVSALQCPDSIAAQRTAKELSFGQPSQAVRF